MAVAITGHTRGIGQGLAQAFAQRGETVVGFSRSTGWDITAANTTQRMLEEVSRQNCHTLILNAHAGFVQTNQLYAAFNLWKDFSDKTIIVLGSYASHNIARKRVYPYAVQKAALDSAANQLHKLGRCRIINVRPGLVDTERADKFFPKDKKRMSVDTLVKIILYAYDLPRDLLLQELVVIPRDPG